MSGRVPRGTRPKPRPVPAPPRPQWQERRPPLHLDDPRDDQPSGAFGWAVIGFLLSMILLAWFVVLPRL